MVDNILEISNIRSLYWEEILLQHLKFVNGYRAIGRLGLICSTFPIILDCYVCIKNNEVFSIAHSLRLIYLGMYITIDSITRIPAKDHFVPDRYWCNFAADKVNYSDKYLKYVHTIPGDIHTSCCFEPNENRLVD